MSESILAKKVAYHIISHFDKSYRWFTRITRGAQERFEQGRWQETQSSSKERITIYERSLSDAVAEIFHDVHPHRNNNAFWQPDGIMPPQKYRNGKRQATIQRSHCI